MRSEDRMGEELRSAKPEERRLRMTTGCLAWAGAFVMASCLALPQAAVAATGTLTWNNGDSYTITCSAGIVSVGTTTSNNTPGKGVTSSSVPVTCSAPPALSAAQLCQSMTASGQTACAAATGCKWYPQFTIPASGSGFNQKPAQVYQAKCDIAALTNYPPNCATATTQVACQTVSASAGTSACTWQPSACPTANVVPVPCGMLNTPACTTPRATMCNTVITTGTCGNLYTQP